MYIDILPEAPHTGLFAPVEFLWTFFDRAGKALVRCEFYRSNNRFHLCRYIDESYDWDYIEAYFNEDEDELDRIENAAQALDYAYDHRDSEGRIIQPELIHLECETKFISFQPIEEFLEYILVISGQAFWLTVRGPASSWFRR
ncbi:hypothetical protein B0H13DRAFT_1853530 [Mycena leptocephala]|nr:hypothetical protein B0H13DRAFT_1853530 [Mycena leptocephala]